MLAMAKKAEKRPPGRPPAANPKKHLLQVRVDDDLHTALTEYKSNHGLEDDSAATRDALRTALTAAGFLKRN